MGSHSTSSCQGSSRNGGSSSSTNSDTSYRSKSTAPTICSDRPSSKRMETIEVYSEDPRDSTSTYASTIFSEIDAAEPPRYGVVDRELEVMPPDVIPSNPSSFGKLFPSSRRLLIRHDDATLDGNMNLRVDTMVHQRAGYQQDIILFHLRMYDLFSRKFSFRRYCRESGREVCHSERRPISVGHDRRPVFRRSWNSVLANLRPGSGANGSLSGGEQKRRDSVSKSAKPRVGLFDDEFEDREGTNRSVPLANSTLLEFSNYAHVEIKRRGAGPSKRYEYEYWSTKFQWRREGRKEGDLRGVSYHLVDTRTSKQIAYIVPEILTPMEAAEEKSKGGWVPPSSMWISDSSVYEKMSDAADVIVATGLMVLVDDCIRRRWESKQHPHLMLPVRSSITKGIELMGPRRLREVLHRRGSA